MPQLGQIVYLDATSRNNGNPYVYAAPWSGNVPYGDKVVDKNSYINYLKTNNPGSPELVSAQNNQGVYSDNYRDPSFSQFNPNAPTPSEQYFTPEAKATADANMSAYQKSLANPPANTSTSGSGLIMPPGYSASAPGSQSPQLYLAADGRTVTDQDGNYVSLEKYKQITGQQNTPDKELNWNFVQKTPAPQNNPGNTTNTSVIGSPDFTTGVPQLDAIYGELSTYIEKIIESGQKINPNIELSPNDIQKFLDQATTEVSPYYASQIKSVKDQLSSNLTYLQQQHELKKKADESQFQQDLGTKRESLAGAGLTFSGVRGQQEQSLQQSTQNALDQSSLTAAKTAADAAKEAEGKVGSRNLTDLNLPSFTGSTASLEGKGGFTPGRTLDFYTPSNTTGSLEYSQAGDTRSLSDFLKQQEVQKRTLAFGG